MRGLDLPALLLECRTQVPQFGALAARIVGRTKRDRKPIEIFLDFPNCFLPLTDLREGLDLSLTERKNTGHLGCEIPFGEIAVVDEALDLTPIFPAQPTAGVRRWLTNDA